MTDGEQVVGGHREHGSPQKYAEAFLRAARPALEDFPVCRGARLESLDAEYLRDGETEKAAVRAVSAMAVVIFRGRRFSFRRWPRPIRPPRAPVSMRPSLRSGC